MLLRPRRVRFRVDACQPGVGRNDRLHCSVACQHFSSYFSTPFTSKEEFCTNRVWPSGRSRVASRFAASRHFLPYRLSDGAVGRGRVVRSVCVSKTLADLLSGLPWARRNEYRIVRVTLSPVSLPQVRFWLWKLGAAGGTVIHREVPAPGFVRLLIRRHG